VAAPDAAGNASGNLYQDAGEGYGYQRQEFKRRVIACREGKLESSLRDEFDLVTLPA
jgi:hypothetical protein